MKGKTETKITGRYSSGKWQLATFVIVIGTIALFVGRITGTEFAAIVSLSLTIYSGANVAQKAVLKNDEPAKEG